MPSPYFTAILSGTTTSTPAIYIDRPAPALAIQVPSMAAADLRCEFGGSSGAAFSPLVRADGSGTPFSCNSNAGPATAIVPYVAAPWARLTTAVAMSTTVSFTINVVRPYP